jgi:hypothetical protein
MSNSLRRVPRRMARLTRAIMVMASSLSRVSVDYGADYREVMI